MTAIGWIMIAFAVGFGAWLVASRDELANPEPGDGVITIMATVMVVICAILGILIVVL